MSIESIIYKTSETLLFIPFIMFLFGSIFLSIKTRFVQIRTIPKMLSQFFSKNKKKETKRNKILISKRESIDQSIPSKKALFTAMATTLGVGAMISPIIAIGFGGPGALLGFALATIFGGASTFTEVTLAVKYREKLPNGKIFGGPMQYIKKKIDPTIAKFYALMAFLLLASWQSNQSNTLASLLKPYNIPTYATGIITAILILFFLLGGIKKVGNISQKLVPFMFILYSTAGLWIIFCNISKLPGVLKMIFSSAFSPKALSGAAIGTGVFRALRWGLAKGFYSNESGVGTAAIPHSMTKTVDPVNQGIISIIAVYSNGFLCLLTGLVVLVTGVWNEPGVTYNINLLVNALSKYFPTIGPVILVSCATMFSFTTILGNGYNGSQCFLYATKNKYLSIYYIFITLVIFFGAIAHIRLVWAITDFFIVPVAFINILSLIMIVRRNKNILEGSK